MTKEKAIRQLNELTTGDSEGDHIHADMILIEFLKHNGHTEVADAWLRAKDRCKFWYA